MMPATALASKPKKWVARGASVVPPTGGWDALSSIANMPPDRAVRLENWFPGAGYVEVRKGFGLHEDTGTGLAVESLLPYQGTTTTTLFAASGTSIFDVTGGVATVTGLSNARWQDVNFSTSGGHFLWICNGADTPRYFDGSSWTAATITGVTPSDMVHVVAYRSRLWTVLKDSTKAAYLPADSIQGAAVTFDVGAEFTLGGYLQAIGTWSSDNADGPTSYIVFVSSFGQVVVYDITDPTTPTGISLKAKADMGSPIGRRCLTKVGADLALVCLDGVIPISQAIAYDRAALIKVALTALIQPVVNQSARDYFNNFGWELTGYPRGTMAILNVPVLEGESQEQYVMNTVTGAWCRFTGQNANCWAVYDNRLFFGGNDGVVYEADKTASDYGSQITANMKTAFNYYKTRGTLKRWTMCRPLITTDGTIIPSLGLDVDFGDTGVVSPPNSTVSPGAQWDIAEWDVDVWPQASRIEAKWQSVSGIGYCAAIVMEVNILNVGSNTPIVLQINGFDMLMENASGMFI